MLTQSSFAGFIIAFWPGITACDRAKEPDIICTMSYGDARDVIVFIAKKMLKSRSLLLRICSIPNHTNAPSWFCFTVSIRPVRPHA